MKILIVLTALLCLSVNLKLSQAETHFAISSSQLNSLRQSDLQRHNSYRSQHHSPDLVLSAQLNSEAQAWAEHLASTGTFQHDSNRNGAGENLYLTISSSDPSASYNHQASDAWYDEVVYYDFNNPGFSSNTGHFTQVVWKASTQVGFGYATGSFNGYNGLWVVARYSPAGNYYGQFDENVLQP